jgi:hypothetical protein
MAAVSPWFFTVGFRVLGGAPLSFDPADLALALWPGLLEQECEDPFDTQSSYPNHNHSGSTEEMTTSLFADGSNSSG